MGLTVSILWINSMRRQNGTRTDLANLEDNMVKDEAR